MESPPACPICGAATALLDVIDFNKSCFDANGEALGLSGVPVYYALCGGCGFCFAPGFASWTPAEFTEKIYNDDYARVDPEYRDKRPRGNRDSLLAMFGERGRSFRHLDYGGGSGLMSSLLRDAGWQSTSYDPFVDRDVDLGGLGRFDLITAFEVFEHVADVRALMGSILSLLATGGLVFVSTLVSDGHINRAQRLGWWYAAPRNGHISLYSRSSLELLAKQHGLQFASFSEGFHVFFTTIPPWAAHLTSAGPGGGGAR